MQDADNKILENVVSTSGLDVHLADLKCAEGLNAKFSSSMFVSHCLFSVNSSLPRCVLKLACFKACGLQKLLGYFGAFKLVLLLLLDLTKTNYLWN